MFLDRDFGIPFVPSTHEVKVIGRRQEGGMARLRLVRRGNRVTKCRTIKFEIVRGEVPAPYEVYRKV